MILASHTNKGIVTPVLHNLRPTWAQALPFQCLTVSEISPDSVSRAGEQDYVIYAKEKSKVPCSNR